MEKHDIDSLVTVFKDKDKEVLFSLFSEHSNRWRHSSNQMWTIGSVFIPLSLSGVVIGFKNPYHTVVIAIFSIILIWIWYFISARLRTMIDKSQKICSVIEITLLEIEKPYPAFGITDLIITDDKKQTSLRHVRMIISIVITIAWLLTVIFSFLKIAA